MSSKTSADAIFVKSARVNNLKNIDVIIPRNKLIVITGLSGSGKSSLAFDTLYAEGQRRYVESLSSYARQFLGRIHKPEVDYIHGIPPAIAIQQKVNTSNPRSTVGTSTEVYDYLKLLFARIGKTYSPISGNEVKKHSVTDVVNFITSFHEKTKLLILTPVIFSAKDIAENLAFLKKEGFTRLEIDGVVKRIEEVTEDEIKATKERLMIVIDRVVVSKEEESVSRYGDSALTAFQVGNENTYIRNLETGELTHFSSRFELDGLEFEDASVHLFSFNSPLGACPTCEGYGKVIGIDEDLVIPDKSLSVYEDAIVCWKGETMSEWKRNFINSAVKHDFPIHRAYADLSDSERDLLWKGTRGVSGINAFFDYLEEKKYKIQYRVIMARYRGKTTCPECKGSRLKKQAVYVKIGGKSISDLVLMPITTLIPFFDTLQLDEHDSGIASRLLIEIKNRLNFLLNVGLGYLTLNRLSATLSGGESQRINLATALGSSLVGSLYILDEPSIGLHPRDTHLLINVLRNLQQLGNTVLVVEHDEDMMRAADLIIDIGPHAGRLGGEVVFQGDHQALLSATNSLTADYLTGRASNQVPHSRRRWNHYIEVKGARENNLKRVDVKFPLHVMTVVTGVSGSGKSSLVKTILYPALNKMLNATGEKAGAFDQLKGDVSLVKRIEFVDQNPIGRSSRSNPVTYVKAYDEIRKLFAKQAMAQHTNFTPSHFSFNIEGGRCEECQGEGIIKVEMQFMADVELICESCGGKRFKEDVLDIKFHGLSIFDVLELTIDEAIDFFGKYKGSAEDKVVEKLRPLQDVGLGYVKLGQSSSTLSGGESQRVKLASFLGKDASTDHTLFIFDEPTTGLHFHDVRKLLDSFNALLSKGHSLIVVEHNLDVIKSADWVIDLGPEGGEGGGQLVFAGTPEELANCTNSYTGKFLKDKL